MTVNELTEEEDNEKNSTAQEQHEKEIFRFKQSLNFHFMSILLTLIHGCVLDKRFKELLKSLEDYVYDCLSIPDGLDILEEYVVCECVK